MHLNGKGYKATLEGENKDDVTSGDAAVRDEYVRKNGDLFREILRMFNAKSEAGKTLMLQIQDEFDNDHDGYGVPAERHRGHIMEQAGLLPYGASRYAGVKRGQPSCDHGGVRLRWTSA